MLANATVAGVVGGKAGSDYLCRGRLLLLGVTLRVLSQG